MGGLFSRVPGVSLDLQTQVSELNLMRRVFESVVNGISISDATADDLPLVYVNPAFEKMTGYKSAEVLGRNCRFLQRGETSKAELAKLRRAIRQRRDVRTVLKNYTKAGVTFWNELYLSPVFDGTGRLAHYVGIQNDVTGRVEMRQKMEYMAQHDSLTDLANRALVMDRLQESLARAERQGKMTALLFIDLDGFKGINDRYGHDAGDEMLRVVGARLKLAVRGSDCAARLGGDEFLLVSSDLSGDTQADEMRSRVVSWIEAPFLLCGKEIVPRASAGLSVYPRDGSSAQELLKVADVRMYMDKQARAEPGHFVRPSHLV